METQSITRKRWGPARLYWAAEAGLLASSKEGLANLLHNSYFPSASSPYRHPGFQNEGEGSEVSYLSPHFLLHFPGWVALSPASSLILIPCGFGTEQASH